MSRTRFQSPLSRVLLGGVLFVAVAATGIAPTADGDIYWHLAAGREMVARGALLFSDPFSTGAGGRPWVDVHWLFQLGAYAIHHRFGLAGLVWAKCLLLGASALVLAAALENKRGSWTRGFFLLLLPAALFAARSLLLVRPVLLTLLFMALFFLVLERFRVDGRARRLAILPLAQVVWTNVQGLSAIGPCLIGAYVLAAFAGLCARDVRIWPFARGVGRGAALRRQLGLLCRTLAACLGACLVTPFGTAALALPAKLLNRLLPGQDNVYAQIAENVPPFSLEHASGEFWHLKWALALLGLALWCGGRRVQLAHLLLLGGFGVLALMSNRNVLLFYWLGAPIAALYLAPTARVSLRRLGRRAGPRLALAVQLTGLVSVLALSGRAAAREPTLDRPTPFHMPEASAARLAELPGGAIFSTDQQGGYLIWRLYPRFRPFIDTRLVLRSAEEYRQYLSVVDQPERFAALAAREHFSYVVLPVAYPDRYLGLIATLHSSPDWKLIFSDGSEVLFARRDLETSPALDLGERTLTDQLAAQIDREYSGDSALSAEARLHLATLAMTLGEFDTADYVLSKCSGPRAAALRARGRFSVGDVSAAEALAKRALSRDARDLSSLDLMALIALRRADRSAALGYLRRVVKMDPFDPEASQILANLEENP